MRAAPWIAVGGLTFALLALPLFAQIAPKSPPPAEKPSAKLPITKVTLFSAGIGYFQREGTIDGTTRVDLKVNEEDVNDLILTLLANDPSGKSLAVTYDNKAPAEITLKAFSIDLTENPSIGNLLHQVRGEKVDITDQNGSQLAGQIVSVEAPSAMAVAVATPAAPPIENVSILTEDGLQSLPIGRIKKVKFAKAELQAEFRKALEALAAARGASTKSVGVTFTGQGQRKVSVGYVADAPLWKPTYRVVLDGDKPKLQGFAAIENTTDEDWEGVKIKLVSGRPVTFKMDLYDPLFVPRPVIEPEHYASLRPPMYQGIVQGNLGGGVNMQFGGGNLGQGGGNNLGVNGGQQATLSAGNSLQQNLSVFGANVQGGANLGVGGGFGGLQGGTLSYRPAHGGTISRPSVRSLLGERASLAALYATANQAATDATTSRPNSNIPSVNNLGDLGESFAFTVAEPVTLARFKSAMLPVIQETIESKQVSIYNPAILATYPMKGMYLKNSSKVYFPQGPVTIYEWDTAAGQARLPDLNPGESRLLSYAVELDVRVAHEPVKVKKEQVSYKLVNGSVSGRIRLYETARYSIHNKSDAAKTVWVTQAIRPEWKLVAPEKPAEQTTNLNRFEIAVPAKATVHLDVVETQEVDGLIPPTGSSTRDGPLVAVQSIPASVESTPLSQAIRDGKLHETTLAKETFRLRLTNADTKPHTVPATRTARNGWKLVAPAPKPNEPNNRYLVEVVVPAGGSVMVVDVEEQEQLVSTALVEIPLEKFAALLKSKTITPAVSAALERVRLLRLALRDTEAGAGDEAAAIQEIKDDQTRIRANIERVPKDSDAYKRYLKKFDDQETELEQRAAKLKAHTKQLAKTKIELSDFIRDLKAE